MEENIVAIWKLTPNCLEHRDWRASRFNREVVVRAESEEEARVIATRVFRTAGTSPPGQEIPTDPWSKPILVSVVKLTNSGFPESGREEILDPEDARAFNDT
jgi:hypothetical protein